MDKIADENEIQSQLVNDLSKIIDEDFSLIKKALQAGSHKAGTLTISHHLHHCAEYIELKFLPVSTYFMGKEPTNIANIISFKLDGSALRRCTKEQALKFVLDDLEEFMDTGGIPKAPPSKDQTKDASGIDSKHTEDVNSQDVKTRKNKKRSLELEDSDEDVPQQPISNPLDKFQVSTISLDEIKRNYSASETLLVEVQPKEEDIVNIEAIEGTVIESVNTTLETEKPIDAPYNSIFALKTVKMTCRIYDPYFSDCSSSNISGKSNTFNSVVVSLDVNIVESNSILDNMMKSSNNMVILFNEIIQGLIEKLWSDSIRSTNRLWIPNQIRVDEKVYIKGKLSS